MTPERLHELTGLPNQDIQDACAIADYVNQIMMDAAETAEATIGGVTLSLALVASHSLRNSILTIQSIGNTQGAEALYTSFLDLLDNLMQGGPGGLEADVLIPLDDRL